MSYGTYQYTADSGTTYSVLVPVDFATALGMSAATTQPNLPPEVAPRYAVFTSSGGLVRQAVVQTLTVFSALLGISYTVGGITYTCTSLQGQVIPMLQTTPVNGAALIQGPQGVPGNNGTNGTNGTNGANGTNGTNGVPNSIVAWSNSTTYIPGAGVYYLGSSYVCTNSNTNTAPPNIGCWQPIASKGANGASPLLQADITITAAQFLTLHSAPLLWVPAPPTGFANLPIRYCCTFLQGSTHWSGCHNISLQSQYGLYTDIFNSAYLNGGNSETIFGDPGGGSTGYTTAESWIWYLGMDTADPSAGNGTGKASLLYMQVPCS